MDCLLGIMCTYHYYRARAHTHTQRLLRVYTVHNPSFDDENVLWSLVDLGGFFFFEKLRVIWAFGLIGWVIAISGNTMNGSAFFHTDKHIYIYTPSLSATGYNNNKNRAQRYGLICHRMHKSQEVGTPSLFNNWKCGVRCLLLGFRTRVGAKKPPQLWKLYKGGAFFPFRFLAPTWKA
jgi:hypothetical protein